MIDHNDRAKLINEKLNVILERNGYVLEKKQILILYLEKLIMTKKNNKDLTAEQKLVLFEDGTEAPGTSELNHEKREQILILYLKKIDNDKKN